ncbi:MAG TPA: type II toxin-antitoxin system ParD family antitoxin [Desulfobulbaceae bacterium]|nr:type II toxin-antitoxin system ParD family antitoxin [Desulfobulbaceae bacterium]
MPASYALGNRFEEFIANLVESGRYNSKSEVVRDGLRLLKEQEQMRKIKLEELRKAFQEGMDSGASTPADEVLDRLEAKYTRMAEEKGL